MRNSRFYVPFLCFLAPLAFRVLPLNAQEGKSSESSKCLQKLARTVSPSNNILLETGEALGTDLDAVEKWIQTFKRRMIADLYNSKSGNFALYLEKNNNMTLQDRKELAFGVTVKPLFEGQNIYIAVFWSEDNLTQAQMRTELHAYGGGDSVVGTIPAQSTQFLHISCEACRGLKLKGKAFLKFKADIKRQGLSYYPEEKAFFENIIAPLSILHPKGDFDIVSINAKSPSIDTLVHEGHHAFFDSNTKYKQTLLNFWDEHIEGKMDKEIASSFNPAYPTKEILRDEFFAYLLQPKSFGQWNPMDKFKDKYLQKVLEALEKNNLKPIFYP